MDGVIDGEVVVSFLVWLSCFVGKKIHDHG